MELKFFPINLLRQTPKVKVFDAGIDSSNGSDVLLHSGEAISPLDDLKDEQYYVHNHKLATIQLSQGKGYFFNKSFLG